MKILTYVLHAIALVVFAVGFYLVVFVDTQKGIGIVVLGFFAFVVASIYTGKGSRNR